MAWCVVTGLSPPSKMDITPRTPPSFLILPEWCKKMAASLRCVAPLGPHFRLSTDSPLPRGRATSSAAWGRPPDAQLNMLTGREERRKSRLLRSTPVVLRPLGPASLSSAAGKQQRVEKMISINHNVNHYCSEQKSSWEIPWWKLL